MQIKGGLTMTESYVEMVVRHQAELNELPIQWAFTQEQMGQALNALGVEPAKPTHIELVKIPGGGLCTRETFNEMQVILDRQVSEHQALIDADTTGEGFIFDMFDYELGNHEYVITGDTGPALATLGIDKVELESNPALQNGLKLAINAQWDFYNSEEG